MLVKSHRQTELWPALLRRWKGISLALIVVLLSASLSLLSVYYGMRLVQTNRSLTYLWMDVINPR